MRSLAVINQKGGVGKTTTTANLAHAIAMKGHRVNLIDLDPQGHLTAHFGAIQRQQDGVDRVLQGNAADVPFIPVRDRMQLLPAGTGLAEIERRGTADMGQRLQAFVNGQKKQDFVFIDCPPASGLLIDYALTSVNEVVVPVAADYLALRGLSDLVSTLRGFEKIYNKAFVKWIVITRFHTRRTLCWEVREKLLEYFPGTILATPVRENSVIAEAPSFGKTVFEYKRGSNGEQDYLELADNLLRKKFYNGR